MRLALGYLSGLLLGLAGYCLASEIEPPADSIYSGGMILTMNDSMPRAEALAVRDGKITAVGRLDELSVHRGEHTAMVDLAGRTLLPGFIDSHSHLSLVAIKTSTADMSPPPAGSVDSFATMADGFRSHIEATGPGVDEWVVGWGYDHSKLAENRHPTAADLDLISTEHPILLIHFSTHQAVLNSRGLELVGYDATTEDPPGGHIARKPGGSEPNGIIEEQAWIPVFLQAVRVDKQQMQARLERALDSYARAGFTTIQDGAVADDSVPAMLRALHESGGGGPDVIGFPAAQLATAQAMKDEYSKVYDRGYRTGGVKFVLDGGTPGRTAYLRDPYFVQLPGEVDYRGYPHIADQAQLNSDVSSYFEHEVPVNIHALGDAALDMGLDAVAHAQAQRAVPDHRTNMIHLQVVAEDQIERMEKLGVTATFQIAHSYYFGDLHKSWTLGPERAMRLTPLRSTMDAGINSTIHHDAPVHPVDQMLLIWAAVNRLTLSGEVLGKGERISVMDALKSSTINAAYQYFEEDSKGSIEPGKQADFVVLDTDPTRVDPAGIRDIGIFQTIKSGELIYSRAALNP